MHDAGIDVRPLSLCCCRLPAVLSLARGAARANATTLWSYQSARRKRDRHRKRDWNFLIRIAPDEERFNLYWISNHFIGTWLQVELLQEQLTCCRSQFVHREEGSKDNPVRDQAAICCLGAEQTEADLERNTPELKRPDHLRINRQFARYFLKSALASTVYCSSNVARISCAPGP